MRAERRRFDDDLGPYPDDFLFTILDRIRPEPGIKERLAKHAPKRELRHVLEKCLWAAFRRAGLSQAEFDAYRETGHYSSVRRKLAVKHLCRSPKSQ